jgi:hypothetical protein
MPIKQTFIKNYPLSDTTPITFLEWLATQSDSDQARFHQARARMDAYRQEAIDDGRMTIDTDGNYIWSDEQAQQQGKQQDNECLEFYDRYNTAVGLTVTWTWTEI